MPRWRKGGGRLEAPIDHLSADRLADMVNAERSNPPDLPRLKLPPAPPVIVPAPEESPPADETLVNGWDESVLVERPPAEGPPAEGPPVEGPPVEGPPVEGPPVELIEAATSPAMPPPDLSAAAMTLPAPLPPELSSDASSSVVETLVLSEIGRHRRPTSLRSMALGLRRGILTAHALALMGIIGVLVVATAVLGVS